MTQNIALDKIKEHGGKGQYNAYLISEVEDARENHR